MKRVYRKDGITIYWDSSKCIHSGECFAALPEVFSPRKRPWVNIDAAEARKIKQAVDRCPSGALTCQLDE
ncbi:MAG: (4Fe-4S)-binding protein [Dehalococcoidia bacterium]|jgi:uncharacterized Fe-S cluster protein YjdI